MDSVSYPELADILLNNTILRVTNSSNSTIYFRICEIEFYKYSSNHQDVATHKASDQLEYNKWYFHKFGNGTYKSGTFRGIDITLGSKSKQIYFGILIRSICRIISPDTSVKKENMIEGPCLTVNTFLHHWGYNDIASFMTDKSSTLSTTDKHLSLVSYKCVKYTLYHGTRIGLSKKVPDEWREKRYRYVLDNQYVKKEKTKLQQCI